MASSTAQLLLGLKALADPVRLRLVALCRRGECSVSELTDLLGLSQPRVSQHLKQLGDAGLVERFRDGQRVYYRVPARSGSAARLLELVPEHDPVMRADAERQRVLRSRGLAHGEARHAAPRDPAVERALYRALLDLTVTAPLGDLLDVGCGRGRLLKLLASRANRAIGVDVDASARELARAELLLAGLPNCSLRAADMYRLPFAEAEFDTAILDDVLTGATAPVAVLREAARVLRPGGRLFILQSLGVQGVPDLQRRLAGWCADAGLRLAPPRLMPRTRPDWLLAVARPAEAASAAA
ncbi:MAG TPA: metalloregulator ArsR/SmtB family transcription factor [Woeseiaceae bacterium]|nr:metalloregulator ArsR/SmtB family transcription factor [Woeseiaceae bacterium]